MGRNVRFGSKADIPACSADVRFTPKSGHWQVTVGCPLCAKSGLMRCSKASLFDHLVGDAKLLSRYVESGRRRELKSRYGGERSHSRNSISLNGRRCAIADRRCVVIAPLDR
jgi:hypothetical protein